MYATISCPTLALFFLSRISDSHKKFVGIFKIYYTTQRPSWCLRIIIFHATYNTISTMYRHNLLLFFFVWREFLTFRKSLHLQDNITIGLSFENVYLCIPHIVQLRQCLVILLYGFVSWHQYNLEICIRRYIMYVCMFICMYVCI